ncbi:MAG TPA: DegT/DnrJ/EryC1/StrS family aminotransferase [Gemmatimonadaceae bacterium]|nr:DegT/DnrJ/EryC1/StrS family aminotransferase [Gemmatimonadaceae bacterium]
MTSSPPLAPSHGSASADAAVPFQELRPAYVELRAEIDAAVARALDSGWYIMGGELAAFEREFADYVATRHCVGVANGLDALTLVLRAWDVGPGDEVIVPSNTYVATWLAVSAVGATIVPVEPDERTYVIEPDAVRRAITPRTRVILPVHLYGLPCDLRPLAPLVDERGIRVLEDAAQAHGASVAGVRAGALGHAGAWSFYPTKNLGALGDAGAITTDDDALADRLRVLRNYGSRIKYVNEERGLNSRLDELQAAVLRVKLRALDAWNARRCELAAAYDAALSDLPVVRPVVPTERTSAWHLYVIRVRERDAVRAALAERGVQTLVHYPIPPHRQSAYRDLGWGDGSFPISERIHREVLSLPFGPHVPPEHVERVADVLRQVL